MYMAQSLWLTSQKQFMLLFLTFFVLEEREAKSIQLCQMLCFVVLNTHFNIGDDEIHCKNSVLQKKKKSNKIVEILLKINKISPIKIIKRIRNV